MHSYRDAERLVRNKDKYFEYAKTHGPMSGHVDRDRRTVDIRC
jgi:hypothetical protein